MLGQTTSNTDSLDSPWPGLEGNHHLPPHSIFCVTPLHPHPNGSLSRDSQGEVPKLSWFGLPGLHEVITLCSDLLLGQGLKKNCSYPWELSNCVSHSPCAHRGRVDSRLLVVGSQTASLTLGLSFALNLCCKCPNGPCELIFDIYTFIAFQWYKKQPNARCFDPCNLTLKFWESRRTPKSPFRECECYPHTLPKVGLRHILWHPLKKHIIICHDVFFQEEDTPKHVNNNLEHVELFHVII